MLDEVEINSREISEAAKARPPIREQFILERYNLSADWAWYKWEAKGDGPTGYVLVSGAVCLAKYTRGRKKGLKKWSGRDKTTDLTISVPQIDLVAWLNQWESSTGDCFECQGSGLEWAGWHFERGNRYRTCSRCKGARRSVQQAA